MSFRIELNVPINESTQDIPVEVFGNRSTLGETALVAMVLLATQMSVDGADPSNPLFSEVAIPITYI